MATLEDIKNGAQFRGIVANQSVQIVSVDWIGNQALNVVYRDQNGDVSESTLYRDDEHRLALDAEGRSMEQIRNWILIGFLGGLLAVMLVSATSCTYVSGPKSADDASATASGVDSGELLPRCVFFGGCEVELQKGLDAYDANDPATALAIFTPLAKAGHPDAQYYLGRMYEHGKGVAEDDAIAAKWYHLAAEVEHAKAQNSLGRMYLFGIGVELDHAEAMRWYRRTAEAGDVHAQSKLGDIYYYGEGGIEVDYEIAYMWYTFAADQGQGDDWASANRDILTKRMTPEQITQAKAMAENCRAQNYKNC